ncbi:MAG: type VI secretion system-associated FHA domain protein TagH [Pseudomonadota bacterium]|nr:type VI secretion system-associated FHA domain protein TagH [Pseudomonadota bacterium]
MTQTQRLRLVISNPVNVSTGLNREHTFGLAGGSIGSARNDTWQLSAHRTGAVPGHAEIRFMDGGFCLIDRCGRTYINSASEPVGRGRRARLSEGDVIRVGQYQLRAELAAVGDDDGPVPGEAPVEERSLVDVEEGVLIRGQQQRIVAEEPMQGLQAASGEVDRRDPLDAWSAPVQTGQSDRETGQLLASRSDWYAPGAEVSDEYRDNRDVAMGLPFRQGEQGRMKETPVSRRGESAEERSRQHISGAPLLRGMDSELAFGDSDDMRLFLEEAGQTLKATVQGLLDLHSGEDSWHQALRTRLQPIEDNPLRLGEDYQQTVETLFASERSPVHLSAPSAVEESLRSLRHHQIATEAAIREGLEAILHAFSPEALLRRFHGYRRGLSQNEEEGAWAWEMYQHYYRELSSSRQQGFERLFREVFEQAYDHQLRQLQRENYS